MIQVSRHQTFPFWETMGMLTRGWMNAQSGDPQGGVAIMEEWIVKSLQRGSQLFFPMFHCMKAEAHMAMEDFDGALAAVSRGLTVAAATGETFCVPELRRLRGDLLARMGSPEAELELLAAHAGAVEEKSKSYELRAAMSLARFWRAAGKDDAAQDVLEKARGWFTEGQGTYDLRQADELRAQQGLVRQ